MKIARIHNEQGEPQEFNFPPETGDGAIQAFVRKQLGLPDMEMIGKDGANVAALQGVASALTELARQQAMGAQTNMAVAEQSARAMMQAINMLAEVATRLETQTQRLERALMSPKRLVYDAKGNLIGMTPGDPGAGA